MDVIMGLLAAVFWGATDFLVGVNARAVGVRRAVFFGQFLGLIIMSIILLAFSSYSRIVTAPRSALLLGIIASILTLMGALAISKAFALGKTSIIAPLVTSYGVFTALLSWLSGEHISSSQLLGILICVCGVAFASMKEETPRANTTQNNGVAILFAILSASLYGSSFWLQGKFALPDLGAVAMLWLGYAVGIIIMAPTFLNNAIIPKLQTPPKTISLSLCAASIFNLAGFSAFAWGTLNGSISTVTIISTLSGGIAALIGYRFYNERLSTLQFSGIVLVLVGAIVLHAYG